MCDHRRGALFDEIAKQDWFDGGPNPVVANFFGWDAARLSNHLRDREAAEAPLAWSHTAASETLGLVGTQAAKFDIAANLAGRYFLTAAYRYVVAQRNTMLRKRPIERIKEWPDTSVAGKLPFEVPCPLGDFGGGIQLFGGR